MPEKQVTVCTVSYYNKTHIDINWELTHFLNQDYVPSWIVIENTPVDAPEYMQFAPERYNVEQGPPFVKDHVRPESYHHGRALNQAIQKVQTRYAVILDPDFYIVYPNWVSAVIEHMQANKLAFFGVPWHPSWYTKWRYFPCVHCLFIDLDSIDKASLDFLPSDELVVKKETYFELLKTNKNFSLQLRMFLLLFSSPLWFLMRRHFVIGNSQDTGYALYRDFHCGYRYDVATPVYKPRKEYQANYALINRIIDRCLPDKLSYLPKRRHYYTSKGFYESGYTTQPPQISCEESMWQSVPFGLHLRQTRQSERVLDDTALNLLRSFLKELTDFPIHPIA